MTYVYADKKLKQHFQALHGLRKDGVKPLSRIYMIGDNPASDIEGANNINRFPKLIPGHEWRSILVKTGVWDGREIGNHKREPTATARGVLEAVNWALQEEGWEAGQQI